MEGASQEEPAASEPRDAHSRSANGIALIVAASKIAILFGGDKRVRPRRERVVMEPVAQGLPAMERFVAQRFGRRWLRLVFLLAQNSVASSLLLARDLLASGCWRA